jgi:hypothetical protein
MELVIDGVTKLHFKTFYDRKINNIEIKNRGRDDGMDNSYVFTFREIPKAPQTYTNAMGTGWESEFEVWLSKFPNGRGKYEMFVMGLHGVTCYDVPISEMRTLDSFCVVMGVVVNRCKKYWKSLN